jgi:hypothetical protein
MTTLNLQVAASADDADEGSVGNTDTTRIITMLYTDQWWIGFRWQSVTIPTGATIDTATFHGYISSTAYDDVHVEVFGDNVGDAAVFTAGSGNYDISGRSLTSASVTKDEDAAGSGWYSITGLASIVQEIVDDAGGLSGDALALVMDGTTGVELRFKAYDNDPPDAAKLDIDYTPPSEAAGPLVNAPRLKSLVHGGLA